MRKYKGGVLDDFREDKLHAGHWYTQIFEILAYIFILLTFLDLVFVLPYNLTKHIGPGGCSDKDWMSLGIVTYFAKGDTCSDKGSDELDGDKCKNLGRWSKYDTANKSVLCAKQATQIWNDAVSDNIVGGYNWNQLLAYIIVPTLTVVAIIYGLIFTRSNSGEWVFWILITSLIYFSVSSISQSEGVDILPPDEPSPLTYITKKLDFQGSDELRYSFMARKSDGTSCLVEGVMLGGGIHSSDGAPTYTGDCNADTLPFE